MRPPASANNFPLDTRDARRALLARQWTGRLFSESQRPERSVVDVRDPCRCWTHCPHCRGPSSRAVQQDAPHRESDANTEDWEKG